MALSKSKILLILLSFMFVTHAVLATVVTPLSNEVSEEFAGVEEIATVEIQKTKAKVNASIDNPTPHYLPATILLKSIAPVSTCKWLHHRALLL